MSTPHRIVKLNNWGSLEYFVYSHETGERLRAGQERWFMFPNGVQQKFTIQAVPYSESIHEQGQAYPYTVNSQRLVVYTTLNELVIEIPIEDLQVLV